MGILIRNGEEYTNKPKLDKTLSIEGQAADAKAVGDTKISYTDVVDNLESTATDLPLSANMGKEIYNSSLKVITQSWSGNSTIGTAIKICDIGDILQDKIYVGTVVLTSSGYSSIDNGVIRMHENTSLYYIPQTTQEGLTVVYNILYV